MIYIRVGRVNSNISSSESNGKAHVSIARRTRRVSASSLLFIKVDGIFPIVRPSAEIEYINSDLEKSAFCDKYLTRFRFVPSFERNLLRLPLNSVLSSTRNWTDEL